VTFDSDIPRNDRYNLGAFLDLKLLEVGVRKILQRDVFNHGIIVTSTLFEGGLVSFKVRTMIPEGGTSANKTQEKRKVYSGPMTVIKITNADTQPMSRP